MNMYKIKDHPNLSFKLINRVTGWVTFVIASMTYILTAESTASLGIAESSSPRLWAYRWDIPPEHRYL